MITKITGQTPFQVLTNNFSISPSNEGYTLQISADGSNFSNLFTVGAGVTRLVTGVAANSYYRLLGNESEVVINWMKTCVTEGGSGGSGTTYTAGNYIDITQDVISVTGITPDMYLTSADTENFLTSADTENLVSSAQVKTQIEDYHYVNSGDVKTQVEAYDFATSADLATVSGSLDTHITDVERVAASAITELHTGLMEVSARTAPDMSAYYTSAQTEEAITNKNYVTSAQVETQISEMNYMDETDSEVIATALVDLNDRVNEISGSSVDLSGYYTSAQTEQAITSKNYVTSAQVETQITGKSYITAQALTAYTPTSGFATVNGSALTNGGNITIQGGGGGGGISQADLASSGYLYYTGNGDTNLGDAEYWLKGNPGDGYDNDGLRLVDYNHQDSVPSGEGIGVPDYPKHITTIYQSDYDELVNYDYTDSETFYIVLPDPE